MGWEEELIPWHSTLSHWVIQKIFFSRSQHTQKKSTNNNDATYCLLYPTIIIIIYKAMSTDLQAIYCNFIYQRSHWRMNILGRSESIIFQTFWKHLIQYTNSCGICVKFLQVKLPICGWFIAPNIQQGILEWTLIFNFDIRGHVCNLKR